MRADRLVVMLWVWTHPPAGTEAVTRPMAQPYLYTRSPGFSGTSASLWP